MSEAIGYLRHYRRWDGTPGLKLVDQRKLVNRVAHDFGYEPARRCFIEKADGKAHEWPALRKAIHMAIDDAELNVLVIVPTLDGVQFNLSFLDMLVNAGRHSAPVYVRPGWLRSKPDRPGKLLSLSDDADAFTKLVDRIRQRSCALHKSVGPGLRAAAARGIKIGARHPTAHRFSDFDRSRGGQTTAKKRRLQADSPYKNWIAQICTWRRRGASLEEIAMRLAAKRVVKTDGGRIGPMLVHRILKRNSVSMP